MQNKGVHLFIKKPQLMQHKCNWAPQSKKTGSKKRESSGGPYGWLRASKHLLCEGSLSNLGLFSRGLRRLRWVLINVYKYLKESGRQMDEGRLFSMAYRDGTGSSDLKLEHRKFPTNMQKNFMVWVREQAAQRGSGVSS